VEWGGEPNEHEGNKTGTRSQRKQLKRRESDAQRLGRNVDSLCHSVGKESTGHQAEKDMEDGEANLREIEGDVASILLNMLIDASRLLFIFA